MAQKATLIDRTISRKAGIPFAVAPIPSIGGMTPRPFVGVHGFMIRRSSKKKDLAQEFVEKYLVSKKGVSLLYEMDPRGPSRYDVMKELGDDPAGCKIEVLRPIGMKQVQKDFVAGKTYIFQVDQVSCR